MTGDARIHWKHGIRDLGKGAELKAHLAPFPTWNPKGVRRSITFRSTKSFSDMMIENARDQLADQSSPAAQRFKERLTVTCFVLTLYKCALQTPNPVPRIGGKSVAGTVTE